MKILILQTCDGKYYKPMLDVTQPIHEDYCKRHGYTYCRWDGIKHGPQDIPTFAVFNRIFLLKDICEGGEYDWVLYMDADCIITDKNRSVTEFLHNDFSIVACRGADDLPSNTYDINSGVLFFNMKHPKTKSLIDEWMSICMIKVTVSTDISSFQSKFDMLAIKGGHTSMTADQEMLHDVLKKDSSLAYIYKGKDHNIFNYEGKFIKQILRTGKNSVVERTEYLRKITETLI